MNTITSIYIPRIETKFNAQFIADVFDRNDIALVSWVYIEPYNSIFKNKLNKYNHAYIGIKYWHDTEAAFNFIARLRNPTREARIVYCDDNWWPVDINNTTKLPSNKPVLNVFEEKLIDITTDDLSTTSISETESESEPQPQSEPQDFIKVDAQKTALLLSIIANFSAPKIYPTNTIDNQCIRQKGTTRENILLLYFMMI